MALPKLLQKLFTNGGAGDKLNPDILPDFATVATSGSYNDLSDKPTTAEVGDIKLYAGSNVPDGWFRCDGSTIADMATNYPKLYAVLGTNVLPNSSGMCLQGAVSGIGTNVSAGLPGAVGSVGFRAMDPSNYETLLSPTGVFSRTAGEAVGNANIATAGYITGSRDQILNLDLSSASPLYGASTTVQPPALKVAVLIKHD